MKTHITTLYRNIASLMVFIISSKYGYKTSSLQQLFRLKWLFCNSCTFDSAWQLLDGSSPITKSLGVAILVVMLGY